VDVSKFLYAAAGNYHVECLEFLIVHWANTEKEEPSDDNNTAVQRAVKTNSLNTTKLLLKEGARNDKVDAKHKLMLMIAAEEGFSEMNTFLHRG
jgi:ankyrin repeat protein